MAKAKKSEGSVGVPEVEISDLTKELVTGGEGKIADNRDRAVVVHISVADDRAIVLDGTAKYSYPLKGTKAEKTKVLQHIVNCYGELTSVKTVED